MSAVGVGLKSLTRAYRAFQRHVWIYSTCPVTCHIIGMVLWGDPLAILETDSMGAMRDRQLTPKQLHFARCVASGMTQAAAYREAYDVGETTKPATVHEAASKLMRNPELKRRVEYLIRQREAAVAASALSDRERVLKKLREWVDSAEPGDSNKLRAAELLGKSVGLFKDVVETSESKSPDDLVAELEALVDAATDQSPTNDDSVH